jgi:predicted transcriptional regulator of viral defense system
VAVPDAAEAWGTSSRTAALHLAALARRGWIHRIRRGLYYLSPLESGPGVVAEDPWILADTLFAPCYIGGWSAAEHWGLTEQLFRSTLVATAAHIRHRKTTVLGSEFRLVRVSGERVQGATAVWRSGTRVHVSSPTRTLVDALRDPSWVGGVRHLIQLLGGYRESSGASEARLVEDLERYGNGAANKRAGFLAERTWPDAHALIGAAARRRTTGVIKLDPAVARRGRMNRRWGLWVNISLPVGDGGT